MSADPKKKRPPLHVVPDPPETDLDLRDAGDDVSKLACAFPCSDSGNAELFAKLFGDLFRFDHRRGRWLLWSGHRWKLDSDGERFRRAKSAARFRLRGSAGLKNPAPVAQWALASESKPKIAAALTLAQNEPPIADVRQSSSRSPGRSNHAVHVGCAQ